jgi:GTP cyclohydrolase FolE2
MSETRQAPVPTLDVQAARPRTEVSLTRVGVRGIEKVIRVGGHSTATVDGGSAVPAREPDGGYFFAELECFVDLNPRQAGVHMSRFEEVVNETIDQAVLSETLRAEDLAFKSRPRFVSSRTAFAPR